MILIVPDRIVRQSITPEECVKAVEEGFRLHSKNLIKGNNSGFNYNDGKSVINLYSAHVPGWGLGAKVLSAFENNPQIGERFIHAVVTVHNAETGRLEVVLDGSYLTALRTAAAVAVAARHLSRSDSKVLGILGTGLQARTHLLCHMKIHSYEKVVVWGRNPNNLESYINEMDQQIDVPLIALESPETLCREADVISSTTRSRTPLFKAEDIIPGTHLGVAGPLRQEGTEIPLDLLPKARLFVDSRPKFEGLWDSGQSPEVEELSEVISGKICGRHDMKEITIFKPVGMAFEDVVSARIVVDRVKREGMGYYTEW